MRMFAKLAIATSVALLSACNNPPQVECTVTWPTVQQSRPLGTASTSYTSPVSISGSIAPVDGNVTLDAAAVTVDVSSPNVGFPASGTATLRIIASSGTLISSGSFGWSRSGGELYFSNPSAINSWLQSSGADPATSRIEYALDLNVAISQGENFVAATIEMYNEPVATGAASYNTGGGGGGHCEYPFVCETP